MKLLLLLVTILSSSHLFAQENEHDDNAPIFIVAEQMPMFPDSSCLNLTSYREQKTCADQKLLSFIYSHLNYPSTLRDQGLEGTFVVSFVVETNGSLSNFEILRGNDPPIFAEECIRVLKLSVEKNGAWIPAQQRGTNVRLKINLPCRLNFN